MDRIVQMCRGGVRAFRSFRIPKWLIADGWFDPTWYVARYPDVEEAGVDPVEHYWRHGRFEHRFPAAGVRLVDLRRAHPRVFSGPGFNRLERPKASSVPRRRGRMIEVPRGRSIDDDVAVMIHAFYPDILPSMLRLLRPLRDCATLLVSVCDPSAVEVVDSMISKVLGKQVRRDVRVVPNRGRNFAPLVCEFGAEILRHRYLLHLHTKKSLYIGYERTEWRDFLLESLAGRSIRPILQIFAEEPEVGVIQPAAFEEMPPWVTHWLSNERHGRELFERIGMDPDDAQGVVDYPIGGMFWARVEAIEPLLTCGMTIDDFEPEAGQTDGTLAHAIERTVSVLAGWRGFKFVETVNGQGHWRLDWSARNVNDFGLSDRVALKRRMAASTLVSVDIFDTIVLRPVLDPAALQYHAARAVASSAADAAEWLTARIDAERRAREAGTHRGDVTLEEVYEMLPAAMQAMRTEEMAIESRVAIPRKWLIDDLREIRASGVRMIAVTDTTLPRSLVEALLVQVGADDLFDDVYVSNDKRARKDTGAVWTAIAEAEGVEPKNWLHIGDNEHSDIQMANNVEIGTAQVAAPRAVGHFYEMDTEVRRADWPTSSVLGLSAAALFDGFLVDNRDHVFGYAILGPILASFVGRLMARQREAPDEQMLLFARDCHLVYRAAADLGVKCRYFQVPRRTALAVTQTAGLELSIVVDAGEFSGRLGDLVNARLGYIPSGRSFDAKVELPRDRKKVLAALNTIGDEIQSHGRHQLDGLLRYMASLGLTSDDPLCFVDLGYSATTQRCLSRVLHNPLHGIYCVATPRAAAIEGVEGWFGHDVDFMKGNWFLDNSLLIESLLSAIEGSAVGYDATGTPLLGPVPSVDADRIRVVQSGALGFMNDLVDMFGRTVFEEPADPKCVMDWVSGVPARFLPEPSDLFKTMRIENSFVGRPDDDASVTG